MGRKAKFSKKVKVRAIKEYQDGKKTIGQLSLELGCNRSSIDGWLKNYSMMGEAAFDKKTQNKAYSKELKMDAIKDYLNGEGSLSDIAQKYEIYSETTLFNWLMMYTGHREIKDYKPEGDIYMAKSRKTTYEERLEIVKHCIKNGKSYPLTATHYDVAYSQVYNWVKKYIKDGTEGLKERRGRKKDESELTDIEKLKREIQRLQDKNERLEMENEVIKKLDEVERRLSSTKSGKKRNTSQSKN